MTSYTDEQVRDALRNNSYGEIMSRSLEMADVIDRMIADRTRLKAEVEAAYREGHGDGYSDAVADERGRGGDGVDECWKHSNARKAIGSARAKKGDL